MRVRLSAHDPNEHPSESIPPMFRPCSGEKVRKGVLGFSVTGAVPVVGCAKRFQTGDAESESESAGKDSEARSLHPHSSGH